MDFCSQLQLLLTVGAFCITASAGSMEHSLFHLTPEQRPCLALIQQDQCTSGFTQEYVDLAVQCNEGIYRNLAGDCAVNARGKVCFGILSDAIIPDRNIASVCGSFPTTCSSECRDIFTATRDRLGCCVNTYNDTELSSRAGSLQFSYSLWTLCGVELVAEQCESTINSTQTQLDPTCNSEPYFTQQLYFNVFCRRQFIDSTRNAIDDMCDLSEGFYGPGACLANEDGHYCNAIPGSESHYVYLQVAEVCTNTNVCDPRCVKALNNAVRSLGCCLISFFNNTAQRDWMTFEFWQQCDLTSPGFCESRFNDAPYNSGVNLRASTCVIIIACTLIIFKLY